MANRDVVYCKECEYAIPFDEKDLYDCSCPYHQLNNAVYGNWFCADGKKKNVTIEDVVEFAKRFMSEPLHDLAKQFRHLRGDDKNDK